MTSTGPLAKRIKRHVIGRQQEFFAAASPGLENSCRDELRRDPIGMSNASLINGGAGFNGRLPDCYRANLHLCTANRVLMRISTFKAANFRRLAKKMAHFPWELYLPHGVTPQFHVAARHSRLYHKEAIIDHIRESIPWPTTADDKGGASPAKSQSKKQRIFVRVLDDHFTLSIDSSGELLHKRGLKGASVSAPLRETIAAAALMRAGYTGKEILLDPFCGSGTFSLEAAMRAQNMPAGWFRDFAFFDWPGFRSSQWEHIKRQAQAGLIQIKRPMIFASDKDPVVCQTLQQYVLKMGLSDLIRIDQTDFRELSLHSIMPNAPSHTPGIIIMNPPYGRRMGTVQQSKRIYADIFKKLKSDFRGWRMGLIAPNQGIAHTAPFKVKSTPLFHGGLRLRLMVGTIS